MGMIELGIAFDYAQMVIDNEVAKMVKKAVEGITITDETLAVDVIKEVGSGGNFIMKEHTFRHMKKVQSQTRIFDRRVRDGWLAQGGRDLTERAYEEANNILKNHKPDPLPEGVASTIRAIIEEAEKEYGIK